ncbi:MAG: hypothetical protein GFH27_549311n106 [Chloroflexi bacterium AL-W]|nr:hypothetical protein [Chloroflexi bacterium AL-N1]NOK68716.1 hypothetical protein [Chloroflexi bacterium AL-N10]NOK76202.1 hypothetical protein [Chloroflexi bacterium AL-N5]NOK84161.1 hypothetical protein [Chloroflexi bacterium AL-W]NOK91340.1 hypothetical protein [Chloroflexi bacterium AL-N15]
MAVTSKKIRSAQRLRVGSSLRSIHTLLYVTAIGLALIACTLAGMRLLNWAQITLDDILYGRPRTFHLTDYVGGQTGSDTPTHFTAMNIDRQVVVFELPGGDPKHIQVIEGPYLVGAHEDLTPVTLSLHDVDGDSLKDLLVEIRQEQIVYLHRDGAFRLPTPEEHASIQLERDQ